MAPTRKTSLAEVLFPVELRNIYFPIDDSTTEAGLLEGFGERRSKRYQRVPHFQAVVDVERNNVFSVVTEGYRLVLMRKP